MPVHRGHQFLIDFARHVTRNLTIVVGSRKSEPISGRLRFQWLRQLYPDLRVVHLQDENPQHPEEHPNFWTIWKNSLERVAPGPIELLFASESYGQKLAEVLGANFIPTNSGRSIIPISGTELRETPWKHWQFLPSNVRPYFAQQVLLFGGQTGVRKRIASSLALQFGGLAIPEYNERAGMGLHGNSGQKLCQQAAERAGLRQELPLLVTEKELWTAAVEKSGYDQIFQLPDASESETASGVLQLSGDPEQMLETARSHIIEGFRGGTKRVFTDFT